MIQKFLHKGKHSNLGMRVLTALLAFCMVFSPMTAFAADIDEDPDGAVGAGELLDDDVLDTEPTDGGSASYTVRWLDTEDEELAYDIREGLIGETVAVEPTDLLAIDGYMFLNDDERNVQTEVLAADGSTELKLYFEEIVSDVDEDANNINNLDAETADEDVDDTVEDDINSATETATYTVEWRNPFNQLIQSQTRVGEIGSEVSVTEEDKCFDKTSRYFFNSEADLNVLTGIISEDGSLILTLYFDDVYATMATDASNEFHFKIDLRPYGGPLVDTVRTDLYPAPIPVGSLGIPSPGPMYLYDKFDWAYVDANFDYVFKEYTCDLQQSLDSDGNWTTPYYGTFWGENVTSQTGAVWYFGWPKGNYIRRITWNPAFESIVPKYGFNISCKITGDLTTTITGSNVLCSDNDVTTYNVTDYITDTMTEAVANPLYDITFTGYELVSGEGVLSDDGAFTINNSFNTIYACYESTSKIKCRVDVKAIGDYEMTYTGDPVTLADDTATNGLALYNYFNTTFKNILNGKDSTTSMYTLTFKGYSIVTGTGELTDPSFENCVLYLDSPDVVVEAVYDFKSISKDYCNLTHRYIFNSFDLGIYETIDTDPVSVPKNVSLPADKTGYLYPGPLAKEQSWYDETTMTIGNRDSSQTSTITNVLGGTVKYVGNSLIVISGSDIIIEHYFGIVPRTTSPSFTLAVRLVNPSRVIEFPIKKIAVDYGQVMNLDDYLDDIYDFMASNTAFSELASIYGDLSFHRWDPYRNFISSSYISDERGVSVSIRPKSSYTAGSTAQLYYDINATTSSLYMSTSVSGDQSFLVPETCFATPQSSELKLSEYVYMQSHTNYFDFSIFDYEFINYEIVSGDPILSDETDYDCTVNFNGGIHIRANFKATAKTKYRVDTVVTGDQEFVNEGSWTISSTGAQIYPNKNLDKSNFDRDTYFYDFVGYEIEDSNMSQLQDSESEDSMVKLEKGDCLIRAVYKSSEAIRLHWKASFTGDFEYEVDCGFEKIRSNFEVITLSDYQDLINDVKADFGDFEYTFLGYEVESGNGNLENSNIINSKITDLSVGDVFITAKFKVSHSDDTYVLRFVDNATGNECLPPICSTSRNITIPKGYVKSHIYSYIGSFPISMNLSGWTYKEDTAYTNASQLTWTGLTGLDNRVISYPILYAYFARNEYTIDCNANLYVTYEDGSRISYPTDPTISHFYIGRLKSEDITKILLSDHSSYAKLPDKDLYQYDEPVWSIESENTYNRSNFSLDYVNGNPYLTVNCDPSTVLFLNYYYANLREDYTAKAVANRFSLNTLIYGNINLSSISDISVIGLSDLISLQSYIDKSIFDYDRFNYEFNGYIIENGSGTIYEPLNENSMYKIGSPLDGDCIITAVYTAKEKPTLLYNTKGGSEIPATYAENDQFMVTRRTPVKDGYIFLGWSKSDDALDVDYVGGDYLAGTSSRTLYAVWAEDDGSGSTTPDDGNTPSVPTAKTYTLTYETGTDMEIAPQKSNTGSFTVTRRTPVKDGYTFAGWSLDENPTSASEVDYFAGDVFPATENVTLHAVFVANKVLDTYTVTYDTKGGSEVKPTAPDDGHFMVTRQVPVKKGYVFAGWALDPDSKGIDYIGGDKISAIENVTLYAVWVKEAVAQKYSLSYDSQGGSEVPDTESVDGKFMVTRRTPKKDGKVFLGWSLYPDDNDIDYIAGDFVLADKNVTLYAVYTDAADTPVAETYTITYDTRGGSDVAATNSYNGIFTVTRRVPEKEGLVFAGWTLDKDSENPSDVDYAGGDTFPAEKDVTLYALYKKADVVINVNGGSDVETNVTIENNQYIIIISIPEKPGYDFPGWDTDGDGEVDVQPGDPVITDDPEQPIDAVWKLKVTPAQYVTTTDSTWLSTVLWDHADTLGDDTVRGIEDALIDADGRAIVQIPDSVPVRKGYIFLGWELGNPMLRMASENGYYQAGDVVYMDEIDSLYENGLRFTAIWEPEDDNKGDNPTNPDDNKGDDPGNTGDDNKGDNPTNPDDNKGDKPDDNKGDNPGNTGDNNGDKPNKPGDDGNNGDKPNKPGNNDGNKPNKPGDTDNNGDKPNKPGKPSGTHTFQRPDGGSSTLTRNPGTTSGITYHGGGKAPQTGDTASAATASVMLLASMAVLVVMLEKKKCKGI